MRRRVLVTGCGRSGTTYTSFLLRKCRLDVPHELKMGSDGIASWLFGVDATEVPWGPLPSEYSFEHIVHLVRDPLTSIPSIATFKRSAWDYIACHMSLTDSDSLLLRSAKYWLHWNNLVENKADLRLRIEEMPGAVKTLCDRIDQPFDSSTFLELTEVPRDLNTRRYGRLFASIEIRWARLGLLRNILALRSMLSRRRRSFDDITWSALQKLDPVLTDDIYQKAQEYGYRYTAEASPRSLYPSIAGLDRWHFGGDVEGDSSDAFGGCLAQPPQADG